MNKTEYGQPCPEYKDIWQPKDKSDKYFVLAVGNLKVLYSTQGRLEECEDIDTFTSNCILIERRGMPYIQTRIFEKGAFYYVQLKGFKEKDIVYFDGDYFYKTGCEEPYTQYDLIIGDMLKYNWPEVGE